MCALAQYDALFELAVGLTVEQVEQKQAQTEPDLQQRSQIDRHLRGRASVSDLRLFLWSGVLVAGSDIPLFYHRTDDKEPTALRLVTAKLDKWPVRTTLEKMLHRGTCAVGFPVNR